MSTTTSDVNQSEGSKIDESKTQEITETIRSLGISSSQNIIKLLLVEHELFGGAMAISVPNKWRDVSLIRQLPDHQECYQDCTFHDESTFDLEGTGGCLIVEILDRQEDVKDEDAAKFFFRDLAEANGSGYSDDDIKFTHVCSVGSATSTDPEVRVGVNNDSNKTDHDAPNLIPKLSTQVKACSCVGYQSIDPLRGSSELEKGKASRIRVELCAIRLAAIDTEILVSLSMPTDSRISNSKDDDVIDQCEEGDHHCSLFLEILKGFNILDWSLFG